MKSHKFWKYSKTHSPQNYIGYIEDLRQAVETAKRILTKEKLDKQLTGQTSTSPFMNIRVGTEKVLFNARDELGDKLDKLTAMMGRLAAKESNEKDHLNSKYIKVEVLTLKV